MRTILVCVLIAATTAVPAIAGPTVSLGGEGCLAYSVRDDALTAARLPTSSHLHSLGAHIRIPYRNFEFSAVGLFAWRNLNFTDTLGVAKLSFDDAVILLSLRRIVPIRQFRIFGGFGPAVHSVRYALDPPGLRIRPERSVTFGAALEAGAFWQTPLPRLEIGGGVRHLTVPDPTARFTQYWLGFSVWTPRN